MANLTAIFGDLPSFELTMNCSSGKTIKFAMEKDVFLQLAFSQGVLVVAD
jgi:hypothetical protein